MDSPNHLSVISRNITFNLINFLHILMAILNLFNYFIIVIVNNQRIIMNSIGVITVIIFIQSLIDVIMI